MAVRVVAETMAHGGRAVAHHDGQVVFVDGAYPGETVQVAITGGGKKHLLARTIEVEEPSPARIAPPCIHFGSCGGCQWQSAAYQAQLDWKSSIISDQLLHIGRLHGVDVRETISPGSAYRYRNRMDFKLVDGRPALSRAASHELVILEVCHLMVPPLKAVFDGLPVLPDRRRVTIRAGVATGDSLVMFDDQSGVLFEEVDGVRFRITGRAFFQNNTAGAEELVRLVKEALRPEESDVLLDGYAGGGLFAATVGRVCRRVIGVESDRLGAADFEHNTGSRAVKKEFENAGGMIPQAVDIAVVDPPRVGLRKAGVTVLAGRRPRSIAYVSCDPASFARDAALLSERGYWLAWVQPVDLFPQTFHIELVGCFLRGG